MKEKDDQKILIIEDTKAISKALSLKLSNESIDVVTVSTGREAIDTISRDSFDVILLDLVIPDIDGFSILETLKLKGSKAQVIVLSNLSQKEDIEKAKTFGVKEYFIKADTPISEVVEFTKNCLTNAS